MRLNTAQQARFTELSETWNSRMREVISDLHDEFRNLLEECAEENGEECDIVMYDSIADLVAEAHMGGAIPEGAEFDEALEQAED